MPATHLISVDLPAPLSPTSAMTSPSRTAKSTSCNACTDPKCFETPWSSSVGEVSVTEAPFYHGGGAPSERPQRESFLLAVLLVDPVADLALLQKPFLEEELVVLLRDPHRRQQDRVRAADLPVHAGHLLALDDCDRGRGRCV